MGKYLKVNNNNVSIMLYSVKALQLVPRNTNFSLIRTLVSLIIFSFSSDFKQGGPRVFY